MKTPAATKVTTSAPTKRKFAGTDNPSHLRVIAVLLHRPISEVELESVAGASDGHELVEDLRRLGLDAPCERISFPGPDGETCCPFAYSFSTRDHRLISTWMAQRKRQMALACGKQKVSAA